MSLCSGVGTQFPVRLPADRRIEEHTPDRRALPHPVVNESVENDNIGILPRHGR